MLLQRLLLAVGPDEALDLVMDDAFVYLLRVRRVARQVEVRIQRLSVCLVGEREVICFFVGRSRNGTSRPAAVTSHSMFLWKLSMKHTRGSSFASSMQAIASSMYRE